jgi:replicative DNA helicase
MSAKTAIPELPVRLIDNEGERLIVANILSRGEEFWRIVEPELDVSHFAIEPYRRVFKLIRDAADRGHTPDLSGCYGRQLEMEPSSHDLGLPLLSDLADKDMVPIADPGLWVAKLKRKATERRTWQLAERLRLGLETNGETIYSLDKIREELRNLAGELDTVGTPATIADAVAAIGIDNLMAQPRGVIGSPWPSLTESTNNGMRRGELWIVAARPSVGKSTVALQWGLEACANGARVLFVSLEMPQGDLIKRAISCKGGIPHSLLVKGDLNPMWRRRVAETLEDIGAYRIEITDQLRTIRKIVARIAAARPAYDLVVVDYLGLIESGQRYENRNQEVSALSRGLKLAAMDYGVPILCAHQLNRSNATEKRQPQLSDLRDSGSIEQDADAVLLLHDPLLREQGMLKDALDIILAKQRNGMRGITFRLRMEAQFCRIVETSGALEKAA